MAFRLTRNIHQYPRAGNVVFPRASQNFPQYLAFLPFPLFPMGYPHIQPGNVILHGFSCTRYVAAPVVRYNIVWLQETWRIRLQLRLRFRRQRLLRPQTAEKLPRPECSAR